jgi:hypothetical protein
VFQIKDKAVKGWMWLFIIEGGMTVIVGLIAYFWLPSAPERAWFLNANENTAARARSLRDGSKSLGSEFSLKQAFGTWRGWRFGVVCESLFSLLLNLLTRYYSRNLFHSNCLN